MNSHPSSSISNTTSRVEFGKDYLSPSFFLLRKYIKEKREELKKIQAEDGPLVNRNCLLMQLTDDSLKYLEHLGKVVEKFEIEIKDINKRVEEKGQLIIQQRSLVRSTVIPNLHGFNTPGTNNGTAMMQRVDRPMIDSRFVGGSLQPPMNHCRFMPRDEITIQPISTSNPPRNYNNRVDVNNSQRLTIPLGNNRQPPPQKIIMKIATNADNNNSFRVVNTTTRPPMGIPNAPDLNLTKCLFCEAVRYFNNKGALMRHMNDEHAEQVTIYAYVYSLTPESLASNSNFAGGKSSCEYCGYCFRSKAPLLRHIQDEHPEKYVIFEKVAELKGLKLKALITRPTIPQPSSSKDGLFIFNPVLPPPQPTVPAPVVVQQPANAINTNTNTTPVAVNVPSKTGPASANIRPPHLQPECAARNLKNAEVVHNNSSASGESHSSLSSNKSSVEINLNNETSNSMSDHAYSSRKSSEICRKRVSSETEINHSDQTIRKTRKQQAEAIRFYCVGRTEEEKQAVAGKLPTLPNLRSASSSPDGRVFISPGKRDVVARTISPILTRSTNGTAPTENNTVAATKHQKSPSRTRSETSADEESLVESIREFRVDLTEMSQAEILSCMKSLRTKKMCKVLT